MALQGFNPLLALQALGGAMPQQQPQQPVQQPLGFAGQHKPGFGGLEALMGNPMFGAGMGLLSAAHSGGNPFGAALTGMLGTTAFKRQQQEYDLKQKEFEMAQKQAEAQQKLMEANRREAGKIYETLWARANEDGVIDDWEQGMLSSAQLAMESGQGIGEIVKQLKPPETAKPMSGMGKAAADLKAGLITQDQFNEQMAILRKPLVEMNQPAQPLGSGAISWRNDKGEQPSPLLTIEQAVAMGYNPVSADVRKAGENAAQAAPMLGLVMGFGGIGTDKSLFAKDDAGILERGAKGAAAMYNTKTLDPKSPELIQYNTTKDATLSGIARLSGQVGTLTDLDVDTVRKLWPIPGFTTETVAAAQFRNIVGLLKARGLGDDTLQQLGIPQEFISAPSYEAAGYTDLPQ